MSQLKWTTVRDAIVKVFADVPGVAIVHSMPRLSSDKNANRWLTWMRDSKRINAWTVMRESVPAQFFTNMQIAANTNVLLIGMLQHHDETKSQDEFDEIVDQVLEAFWKTFHLHLETVLDIQGPASLRIEELRQVGSIPVHYAEIALQVQQTINIR